MNNTPSKDSSYPIEYEQQSPDIDVRERISVDGCRGRRLDIDTVTYREHSLGEMESE